jgi:hypothetical protein
MLFCFAVVDLLTLAAAAAATATATAAVACCVTQDGDQQ